MNRLIQNTIMFFVFLSVSDSAIAAWEYKEYRDELTQKISTRQAYAMDIANRGIIRVICHGNLVDQFIVRIVASGTVWDNPRVKTLRYRFDDNAIKEDDDWFTPGGRGGVSNEFGRVGDPFIESLREHDSLVVRFYDDAYKTHTLSFDLSGASEQIDSLLERCN